MTSKPSVRRCIERKAWASGGIEASACLAARVFPIGCAHHICSANHPKFAKSEASPKFMSCGISSILDDYSTNRERWRLSPGSVPAAGVSTRYFSPRGFALIPAVRPDARQALRPCKHCFLRDIWLCDSPVWIDWILSCRCFVDHGLCACLLYHRGSIGPIIATYEDVVFRSERSTTMRGSNRRLFCFSSRWR